jgi:hypothetical protein
MKFLMQCLSAQDNKNKLINCISFGTIGISFIFLAVIFYWLLYPYKPLVINQRPLPVLNKEVKKGDIVHYTFDYCKYAKIPTHVNKKFSDGIEFALPEYDVNNPSGCRVQTIATEIPMTLPEGEYIIIANYTYHVNPIRTITIKTHTEKFKVIE